MNERSIFAAALDIADDAARVAYLDRACGNDAALRREVNLLLAAQGKLGSFLDKAPPGVQDTVDQPQIAERVGTTIGPYRLMEQIGEGGMGLVFVAEQLQPVRRKVALKIIKPGMGSRDVIARFEAERQQLALMDHPHIARVLDAGTTPSGLPYFVMELVKGIPIIEYCDGQCLTSRERLDLFLSVCQAVQHAHSKGIIHRDLKPSNILVAPHDGVPVVKVIDFGVAKAIGQQLTDKTIYTRLTQMIGTPLYMSPEQAEINALDVDIRSDVYSLGVLFYELLTGSTPFDRQRFAEAAYDEIRRIIKEEEPPKPSTRLSSLGATLTKVSQQRKTEPAKLSALVKGDLDWIVMKALEKDRNRRYETASAFAADVRRFLADEPIEARPPSTAYRLRKFARRHKSQVTVASVVLLALVGGIVGTSWGLLLAIHATELARAAEKKAQDDRDEKDEALQKATKAKEAEEEASRKLREEKDRIRRLHYVSLINRAQNALNENRIPLLMQLLEETTPKKHEDDLRGWEWYYLDRQIHRPVLAEFSVDNGIAPVFSPDGRWATTWEGEGVFRVWDVQARKQVGRALRTGPKPKGSEHPFTANKRVFSPDGEYLAVLWPVESMFFQRIRIWRVADGEELPGPAEDVYEGFGAAQSTDMVLGQGAEWVAWTGNPIATSPPSFPARPYFIRFRVSAGIGLLASPFAECQFAAYATFSGKIQPLPALSNVPARGPRATVARWERTTGEVTRKSFTPGSQTRPSGDHSVSLSPDGQTAIWSIAGARSWGMINRDTASNDPAVECWDLSVTPPKLRWPPIQPVQVKTNILAAYHVAINPSWTALAIHDGVAKEMTVYRISDGREIWHTPVDLFAMDGGLGKVKSVSDDGKRVLVAGQQYRYTILEERIDSQPMFAGNQFTALARHLVFRTGTLGDQDLPPGATTGIGANIDMHSYPGLLTPDGRRVVLFDRNKRTVQVFDVTRDPSMESSMPGEPEPLIVERPVRPLTTWVIRDPAGKELGRVEPPPGRLIDKAVFVAGGRRMLVRHRDGSEPGEIRRAEAYKWSLYDLDAPLEKRLLGQGNGWPKSTHDGPFFFQAVGRNTNLGGFDSFVLYDAKTGKEVIQDKATRDRSILSAELLSEGRLLVRARRREKWVHPNPGNWDGLWRIAEWSLYAVDGRPEQWRQIAKGDGVPVLTPDRAGFLVTAANVVAHYDIVKGNCVRKFDPPPGEIFAAPMIEAPGHFTVVTHPIPKILTDQPPVGKGFPRRTTNLEPLPLTLRRYEMTTGKELWKKKISTIPAKATQVNPMGAVEWEQFDGIMAVDTYRQVVIDTDRQRVFIGTVNYSDNSSFKDSQITVLHLKDGKEERAMTKWQIKFERFNGFDPDGRLVLTNYGSGQVQLWNPKTGQMDRFPGHEGGSETVQFSPDGSRMFVQEADGAVGEYEQGRGNRLRVWDVATQQELLALPLPVTPSIQLRSVWIKLRDGKVYVHAKNDVLEEDEDDIYVFDGTPTR